MVSSFCALAGGAEIVTITAENGAQQPQLAVDAEGTVHVTFGSAGEVFYTNSVDGGASYREPWKVASVASLALGRRRGPRIAAAAASIVIAAIGGSTTDGAGGDLFAWSSPDKGESWHGPVRVNDVDASAREGLHGLAAGPDGQSFCAWLDLRNNRTQIFGSRSTDGGRTWTENMLVYKSPDGTVCECCHPSVAFDETGTLYVMWRNWLGGHRDMYVASSHDGGATFEQAAKLGRQSWPLNACPMDGGGIAAIGAEEFAAVWRRDQDVILTRGRLADEQQLGVGQQPWLAADRDGIYAAWLANRGRELQTFNSRSGRTTGLEDNAQYPVIAARPGSGGPVVVGWETNDRDHSVIRIKTIIP
jgi:hypothetical protein